MHTHVSTHIHMSTSIILGIAPMMSPGRKDIIADSMIL